MYCRTSVTHCKKHTSTPQSNCLLVESIGHLIGDMPRTCTIDLGQFLGLWGEAIEGSELKAVITEQDHEMLLVCLGNFLLGEENGWMDIGRNRNWHFPLKIVLSSKLGAQNLSDLKPLLLLSK